MIITVIYYLKNLTRKKRTEAKIIGLKILMAKRTYKRNIAKLRSSKDTSLMKKRREIIKELCGIPKDVELNIKKYVR